MSIYGKYSGNRVSVAPYIKYNGTVKKIAKGYVKLNGVMKRIWRYISPSEVTWDIGHWTAPTLPATNTWKSMCYSPQLKRLVVAAAGKIISTTDGINWTTSALSDGQMGGPICWSPEKSMFIMLSTTDTDTNYFTSSDGIIWTKRSSLILDDYYTCCCWASGLGKFYIGVPRVGLYSSTDGLTWVKALNVATTYILNSIAWSPTLNMLLTISNMNLKAASTQDGETWTARTLPINGRSLIWCVAFNKFYYVSADGDNPNIIASSADGINWTLTTLPVYSLNGTLVWSEALKALVMVRDKNSCAYTRDGVNWTAVTANFGTGTCVALAPLNEVERLFTVTAGEQTAVYASKTIGE